MAQRGKSIIRAMRVTSTQPVLAPVVIHRHRDDANRHLPIVEDTYDRPRRRSECREAARPCPWVSCKHHLYLDVTPETGTIKVNFPDLEPWDLVETCALDIAERGGVTLEEVAEIMNLTRERIRQIEVRGLLKLRMASPSPDELGAALFRRPGQ